MTTENEKTGNCSELTKGQLAVCDELLRVARITPTPLVAVGYLRAAIAIYSTVEAPVRGAVVDWATNDDDGHGSIEFAVGEGEGRSFHSYPIRDEGNSCPPVEFVAGFAFADRNGVDAPEVVVEGEMAKVVEPDGRVIYQDGSPHAAESAKAFRDGCWLTI